MRESVGDEREREREFFLSDLAVEFSIFYLSRSTDNMENREAQKSTEMDCAIIPRAVLVESASRRERIREITEGYERETDDGEGLPPVLSKSRRESVASAETSPANNYLVVLLSR